MCGKLNLSPRAQELCLANSKQNGFDPGFFGTRRGRHASAGVAASVGSEGRSAVSPIPGVGMQSLATPLFQAVQVFTWERFSYSYRSLFRFFSSFFMTRMSRTR
eukprot:2425126-Pyramimonas_sp.AAC.1